MNMRELGRGANSRLVTTCPLFRPTNIPVFFSCGVAIVSLLLGSNLLQWPVFFLWGIFNLLMDGRRRDRGSTKVAITMAVLLLSSCGISVGEPLLTIQSPDGDLIDCLNTMDQPSLKNPLLEKHIFQETPSDHVKTEEDGFGFQVWHSKGITCPRGTIPIRRFDKNISHTKYGPLVPNAADRATKGHEYAIAEIKGQPVYGTKASLNVWSPIVESREDFSLAQIWLVSGQYEENNLNTIEAGWQVYPNRYGDHQPRLFTYWTRDAYLNTGCYSTHCAGFVHVSSTIALEAAITRTSTFGGDQFAITLQLWKDVFTGNWWMGMGENVVPVGYWPAKIFTTLSDHAITVQWGGEVFHPNTSGKNTVVQMGSGKYPNKGFRQAACFCNIRIAKENRTVLPIEDFVIGGTQLDSYTIRKSHSKACGTHFYYGGPGPLPSASVRGNHMSIVFLFFSFYLLV